MERDCTSHFFNSLQGGKSKKMNEWCEEVVVAVELVVAVGELVVAEE